MKRNKTYYRQPEPKQSIRLDGFNNLYTGKGTTSDSDTYTKFNHTKASEVDITNIFRFCRDIKKAILIPIEDMLREGINIEQDKENIILRKMESLKWKKIFTDAMIWNDVYGGSIIVKGFDGDIDLAQPADTNKEIKWLRVYDKRSLTTLITDIEDNILSTNYGNFNKVFINDLTGKPFFEIHWTRFILFDGEITPETEKYANNGFGDSRLDSYIKAITDLDDCYSYNKQILRHMFKKIFINPALSDMLDDPDGSQKLEKRAYFNDLTDANSNTIYLGRNEDYKQISISSGGSTDILKEFRLRVCSVTDIPEGRFFLTSSGGLNTTKEEEMKHYYNGLASRQEYELKYRIQNLVDDISDSYNLNKEDMQIEFVDLNQMSQKELAELRDKVSITDERYINNKVLGVNEVRASRFENGSSTDTIIMNNPEYKEENINNKKTEI